MPKKKTVGLDQVMDRLRRDLDGLINSLVEQRVNEAFAAVQALGKSKTKIKRSNVDAAEAQKNVLAAIQGSDLPIGAKGIREATGYGNTTVSVALKALLAEGLVQKTGERRATVYLGGAKKKKPAH